MRNIDEAGYTMAKSAVVTLTRSFGQKSRNGPWRQHGIKAFALCPWFANTQLVQNAGFDAKAMEKKTNFRVLTVSEVTFLVSIVNKCREIIFKLREYLFLCLLTMQRVRGSIPAGSTICH